MKRALVLLIAVLLAGCASTEEEWGGYTEGEVKDLLKDAQFKQDIVRSAPPSPSGPIEAVYPSQAEIDDADLKKATIQGDEYWGYEDAVDQWCIFVAEDPETGSFIVQVGCNLAD